MVQSLDRRTRLDADRRPIAPDAFFTEEFPLLAARHGSLVAAGMEAFDAPPLAIEVDGAGWTIQRAGDGIAAVQGTASDALVIVLSRDQFADVAQNHLSFNGLLVGRALVLRGGTTLDASVWDSLWLTLLEGWPATAEALTFVDRHGAPLDLHATFGPDADPADMAHFLREAGYVHLRGWFDPADMAAISADMDHALPSYVEGDGKSWWAALEDGSRRCVRLQAFVEHSPTTAALLSGEIWARIRTILGDSEPLAQVPVEGRIIEALFKPVGVVAGPSDVEYHRDCHLGRHAYACSRLTLGIALTPTSEANGLLRVVAGSHRVLLPVEHARAGQHRLPVVNLPTHTGDVTVHLSCTLHESTPPKLAERRVMYTEIPLATHDGSFIDTTGDALRKLVSELSRQAHEEALASGEPA